MGTPTLIYDLREGSGTTATDRSSGTAANATLTFGGADGWTGSNPSTGVAFTAANSSNGITAALGSTKVETAHSGIKTVTLESRANVTVGCVFALADTGNANQIGAMFLSSSGTIADCYIGDGRYIFNVAAGKSTFHLAGNSGAAAGSRIVLYQNGTAAGLNVLVSEVTSNVLLDAGMVWTRIKYAFGTFTGTSDFVTGSIYESALYAAAFTSGQASANHTALASNDDADPNVSAGNTMTVAATSPVSTMAASLASKDSLSVAATSPVSTMAAALASTDILAIAATSPVSTMAAALATVQSLLTIAATSPVSILAAALASTDLMTIAATSPVATMVALLSVTAPPAPVGITMPIPYTARMT